MADKKLEKVVTLVEEMRELCRELMDERNRYEARSKELLLGVTGRLAQADVILGLITDKADE